MTRRTLRRDLALIIGATIVIVVIAWLVRQPRAETCREHGCVVLEADAALAGFREYERVDGV